jgi:dihydrofolate reductase
MKSKRKIIVYIATSADGYIARPDGNVDWLNRPRTAGDYGMGAFFKSIDTILWGRKTYDVSLGLGGGTGGFGPKVKNYVFTHRPPEAPCPASNSSTNRSCRLPSACAPRKARTSG